MIEDEKHAKRRLGSTRKRFGILRKAAETHLYSGRNIVGWIVARQAKAREIHETLARA